MGSWKTQVKSGRGVRARRRIVFISDARAGVEATDDVHISELSDVGEKVTPIVYTIPLQLLAYHVAVLKGTDVDQPRNLAKSVTVE